MNKFILVIITLILSSTVQAGVNVGCLSVTQRVLREDSLPSSKSVHLYAAKNETRSFQILFKSDIPAKITSLRVSNFLGKAKAVIFASNVKLYREHQLHITQPTYRNTNFREGWYPDALIPFINPIDGKPLTGARFTAVPFDLPVNETHGFWVDVFVPANAKAGDYKGKVTVKIEGEPSIIVPVTLSVWNFKLPDTPTLKSYFGSPIGGLKDYYSKLKKLNKISNDPNWEAINKQCSELLAENRIDAELSTPINPVMQQDGSFVIPAEQITALREFIDKYHLNLYMVGHPNQVIKDPVLERDKLNAWLKAWDKAAAELNRPQVTLAVYLLDEPNTPEAYKYVQKWGKTIKAAKSVIKVMVVEQPKTQDPEWGDLYGAVDIWCPLFSLFDGPSESKRQSLGETIWTYTALCQLNPTPWWHTDQPLLNYNVSAWISWRYGIKGLLYWGGMAYWDVLSDVWTQPITFDTSKESAGQIYNGEGSSYYPGYDVGYDGLAASMRIKALRDSINDYEYLSILERKGRSAEALKIVMPLAPSWFEWEKDPKAYEKARIALAKLITTK